MLRISLIVSVAALLALVLILAKSSVMLVHQRLIPVRVGSGELESLIAVEEMHKIVRSAEHYCSRIDYRFNVLKKEM